MDSPLEEDDNEVTFYCSQSTSKQSSKAITDLTCKELAKSLRKWGLSDAICKVLKDNNVRGKTFVNLTRSDLIDLFADFNDRKELWDCREEMRKNGFKLVLPDLNKDERTNLPITCSPASTLSVGTTSEESSSEISPELTAKVPKLKRMRSLKEGPEAKNNAVSTAQIKPSHVNFTNFKFPISSVIRECVKKGSPVPNDERCQLIRECVTCLKAEYGEVIPNDAFKIASKLICAEVPVLKDVQPPSWPGDVKFEYWTSVLYLLKKRYMNIKPRKSVGSSKSTTSQKCCLEISEKDNESLQKELLKEVHGRKKKQEVNWEMVKKLQRLTFSSRKEAIQEINGNDILSTILEKFPFLDNETCLWNELEFYVSEETNQEDSVDVFAKRWEQLATCFVDDDLDKDDICSAALEKMPKHFNSESSPLVSYLPDQTSLESFMKALPSNDPQLIVFDASDDGDDDPCSVQRFIVVDKEVLLECKSLSGRDAFISLLAVHYAFNLKYHLSHTSMFKFIEEHVLGVMPRRKSYAYRKIENALLSKLKDGSAVLVPEG